MDAYDRGYPADHRALRLALEESVAMHQSQPFATFEDAPAGAALAEMLRRGFGAAVGVFFLGGEGGVGGWARGAGRSCTRFEICIRGHDLLTHRPLGTPKR